MNKHILARKPFLAVVLTIALLALVFAVSLPASHTAQAATELRITPTDSLYNTLSFEISTGSYVPGTSMRVLNNEYPAIQLTLNGEQRRSEVSYQYAKISGILTEDTINDLSWVNIPPTADFWQAVLSIDESIIGSGFRDIFSSYFYFRTIITIDDITYYYMSPSYIDVILDCSGVSTQYGISSIKASYMHNNIETSYNADSSDPPWVGSAITFKVEGLDVTKNNTKFFYSISTDPNKRPFDIQSVTREGVTSYFGVAVLNESYNGEVLFYATDISVTEENAFNGRKYVKLDTVVPEFTVTATTIDHTDPTLPTVSYDELKWANGDVIYTLARKEGSIGLSGLTFYVKDSNKGGTWQPINKQPSGLFIYVVDQTTRNLTFKAVNDAGKEYSPNTNYRTHISTVVPQINLTATDSLNTSIKTMGTAPSINYRVGYASDSINFTITNTNPETPVSGNEIAPVSYQYAIRETDANGNTTTSNFTNISQTNNNYQLNYTISSNSPAVKNRTYIFRLMSGAGFYDQQEFTVSILKSSYSFTMDALDITTNAAGWVVFPGTTEAEIASAADIGVPVYLYVESFLNTSDEFAFYSEIYGDNTTQKRITEVYKDSSYNGANGVQRYIVYIKQTLNRQSMSFFVINKADARSTILTTQELRLDAAKPVGNVTKKNSGGIDLYEDEWSATGVQIRIAPSAFLSGYSAITSNTSGVKCYPLMGGGTVLGREIPLANGYFSQSVSETDNYPFRLISGAGVYTDIYVNVKIDTSLFAAKTVNGTTLPWVSVQTLDGQPVGITTTTTNRYELTKKTAQALRIVFNTTHGDHITYEWAEMINNVTPPQGDFVRVANPNDTTQAFIFSLSTGATGTITYVFNLYSKAKTATGTFPTQMNIVLTISYDNATFGITATTDQLPNRWTRQDIVFNLNAPENVTVSKYQIRLGSDTSSLWKDITVTNGEFVFSGVERFITTSVSSAFSEEVKRRSYGYSYNGEIWFRAISDAGKESQESFAGNFMIDKIDETSTDNGYIYGMHPLYALYQQAGDYVIDDARLRIYLYTNASVKIEPALLSSNNNVRLLYEGKSAVQYYYLPTDSSENTPAPTIATATPVSVSIELNSGWYWIIAHNTTFNSTMTYKVYIVKEHAKESDPNILTAQFDTYSGVGATDSNSPEGYFVFSWKNTATVLITVDSVSPVYYWYKIGATGEWQKYNPAGGAETAQGTKEITFVGEETAKTAEYINRTDVIKAGNLYDTVQFRVTNLAGNVVYIDRSVVVRIEDSVPTFDVTLMSKDLQGRDITIDANNADELNKWYPNSVQILLTPTATNPGGVTYTYQRYTMIGGVPVGIGELEKLPGNGKNFTTDDLSVFQDSEGYVNGALYLFIVATSTATKKTYLHQLQIKIDKTVPEFTLKGKVTVNGVERDIASGDWTNSTGGVTIYRYVSAAVQDSMDNASGVVYQYRRNGSVLHNWDSNSQTENSISSYVFIATTGSGRTFTRSFEVKIDTLPPVIYSGYIEQNRETIETYYIDQTITYEEDNLKYAKYNEYPLTNGQVIATNTVDISNGGFVHIIIEDLAGNKTELKFYMTVFPLNVNTITLSEEDATMLENYISTFKKAESGLQSSRREYFNAYIARLKDRVATLEKMRDEYRAYLLTINSRVSFNLQDDYPEMYKYINYFITDDITIIYPQWLQNEIRAGVYDTYYLKLETEFARLKSLMVNVEAVQEDVTKLPATNVVKKTHYQSILRVYNAYESMSTDQKSVFKDTLYNKLLELKRKCEVLLLQDETTGISIDGPDLAAGVAIEVVNFAKSSELFNNAQLVLLETMGDDEAIVAINKVSLSGYGSQQNTGDILVTLPIPEQYYDYIYFSVYRLSPDGTLTPIQNTTISGNGKSVYFTDNQLDTYVLATRGNITVRPPSAKVYGKIGNLEIDGTMLSYITYVAIGMFVVLLAIMVLMGLKRKGFLRRYNRAYKNSLKSRGIQNIPKGNPPVTTYPNDPKSTFNFDKKIYDKNK